MSKTHKICSKCKQELSVENFYKRITPKKTLTFGSWCKNCFKTPEYREKARKRNQKYAHGRRAEFYKKNPLKYLWSIAKKRAKKNNLEFNIEPEDIVFSGFCPITGEKLDISTNKLNNSLSLDRKDNSKGYVKGNVFAVSRWANLRKSDMSLEILEKMVQYVKST